MTDTDHLPSFDLTGDVVLITGASRGIGAGLVDALVAAGATVAVSARNLDDARAIADAAGAVVYLASPAGAMLNGHILAVDGGWTAQ